MGAEQKAAVIAAVKAALDDLPQGLIQRTSTEFQFEITARPVEYGAYIHINIDAFIP